MCICIDTCNIQFFFSVECDSVRASVSVMKIAVLNHQRDCDMMPAISVLSGDTRPVPIHSELARC